MLYRRNKSSQEDPDSEDLYLPSNHFTDNQDGSPHDVRNSDLRLLLDVPGEALLHITSYVQPPGLLALGKVCKALAEHVKRDSTWHRAFATQCLGISPESNLELVEKAGLMLRKSPQQSWRDIFIARYKILKRWRLSENSPITHTPNTPFNPTGRLTQLACTTDPGAPLPWSASMPSISAFSDTSFGTICRSFPLAGKVANVYTITELEGVGYTCTINAYDGNAKICHGFPDGKISLLFMQRADQLNLRQISPITSLIDDSHNGPVMAVAWENDDHRREGGVRFAVSAATDGVVKIWDTSRSPIRCLWSSTPFHGPAFEIVAPALVDYGVIVCGLPGGDLVVWSGLQSFLPHSVLPAVTELREVGRLDIPCLAKAANLPNASPCTITKLSVDTADSDADNVHILVAYQGLANFYRVSVDVKNQRISTTTFGDDPSLGSISCLEPFFNPQGRVGGRSFVVVGDTLGCINIYDWSASAHIGSAAQPVPPTSKFEAYPEGSKVTAIAWNDAVLVTGSAIGDVRIWDGLNLSFIRDFGPRQYVQHRRGGSSRGGGDQGSENVVGRIILTGDKQVVVFSVGERVVAWWAGPARKGRRGGVRGRHTLGVKKKKATGRNYGRGPDALFDLHTAITESRDLNDETPLPEGVLERRQNEREQRVGLESLGLSEAEAVEYVLMLSRDDHEQAEVQRMISSIAGSSLIEEGVFEADFDIDGIDFPAGPIPSSLLTPQQGGSPPSPTNSALSSRSSRRSSMQSPPTQGSRSIPRPSLSNSSTKVQVSPRTREEPREAGPTHYSSRRRRDMNDNASEGAIAIDYSERHFPIMPSSSWSGSSTSGSISKSPQAVTSTSSPSSKSPSAWSTPLVVAKSLESSDQKQIRKQGKEGGGKMPLEVEAKMDEEMDDDLRFAIELSLAEAVSRGDN